MVITIDPPLPCSQLVREAGSRKPARLCGSPAAHAIITPVRGDAWELLPVCEAHLNIDIDQDDPPLLEREAGA